MIGNYIRKKAIEFLAPESAETTLQGRDTAWSEPSAIYTDKNFEKYNPDSLIGRKGFNIYQKMMIDEQVKAVVKFKRDAVTSRDFIFELSADMHSLADNEVERRINLSNAYIDNLKGSWMDALNGIMSGTENGMSMTEKLFGQFEFDAATWWGIDRLKLKPYDTFYFHVDVYGNITKTIQKLDAKENLIDLDKFIKYVVNPDTDEHYGQSDLRAAYRAWWSKDNIIKFRNMWLERHAGGFRWAQPVTGKSIKRGTPEYNDLLSVLGNINTSSSILLPSTVELNSEYPANNVAFKEAIDDYDTAIARALLVPNLLGVSPQGKHGSLAQSGTQLESFLWTLEADARRLEDALNEQLFRQLGEANFGDDAWPRYKFKPISGSKKMEIINTWKDLVSAGAVLHTESDETHIRELLEFPEATEEIKPDVPPDADPDADPTKDIKPEDDDTVDPLDDEDDDDEPKNSTIVGKGKLVSKAAFTRAAKRVEFNVIAKTSDSIIDEYTKKSGETMDLIVADLIEKAKDAGPVTTNISKNIRALKVDSHLKRRLNSIERSMLREGFVTGTKHASLEIDKAKDSAFSRQANVKRLELISEDYFKTTAFKITGDLTDDAVSIIETEIINGARYDKTWAQVEKSIYTIFASKGMITLDQAKDSLGEALGVAKPDARLRTITRTATFDAINQARNSYFTDPALEDFVIAYEYSSILDSRTTQICKHLDEENRGNHSLSWYEQNPGYRPPNHFNCRSLLIPVTVEDEDSYVEGEEPTIEPQEGFK